MQHIITAYLFQNKTCPLPGLGTLAITNRPAEYDFVNKSFLPPAAQAVFNTEETDAAMLVDYIAAKQNCSVITAIEELGKYCNRLKHELSKNGSVLIPYTGTLLSTADNTIAFTQIELPVYLQQGVAAEKVVHPEAAHTMLVGDKETTTLKMAEYYTETESPKNYWWVWALVLLAIALAAVFIYLNQSGISSFFGNSNSVM